jgi:hypothetical protein
MQVVTLRPEPCLTDPLQAAALEKAAARESVVKDLQAQVLCQVHARHLLRPWCSSCISC